ncbi:Magnetosome protein MamQ [Candidatus Magnetaquicoccaceae bacterium FCR-1]|uniref:Magnetosome protein MamQ n=1 Tax=Candidatus Magnetaquiglobus chichijimensis TaxID=3141448 RepID=A0ABQ0CAG3_9PROT
MADKHNPMDEMDDLGLEMTSSERMQRMRKLMRQLYQEEVVESTPVVELPPIRSKTLILGFSIASILFLVVTTFYNFNRFIAAEEQVLSARGHIHDALQRRSNLFGNLVNLTLNHAMLEQEVFRYVSDGRIGMMGKGSPPAGKSNGEGEGAPIPAPDAPLPSSSTAAEAIARLFGLVEQYPDIKTSTTYQQLMDKLVDIENLISQRRDEYNTDVKAYNTLITTFPWAIMARILGFQRYPYFNASPGPDNKNMDLDSRKFMRLIPEGEISNSHHKDTLKPEHGPGGAALTGAPDLNAVAIGVPPPAPPASPGTEGKQPPPPPDASGAEGKQPPPPPVSSGAEGKHPPPPPTSPGAEGNR